MNERIKELAEQAKAYSTTATKDFTGDEPIGFMDFYTEKFAELVVKETIDEMITQMWFYGMDESNNPQFYKMIDRTIQEMLYVAPAKE